MVKIIIIMSEQGQYLPMLGQLTKGLRVVWSFALFEIILSVNKNDGSPYIETHATRIRLWENIPATPTVFMVPGFLVIKSDPDNPWSLYVYHIPSMRHWEWHAVSNSPTLLGSHFSDATCAGVPQTQHDSRGSMVCPHKTSGRGDLYQGNSSSLSSNRS